MEISGHIRLLIFEPVFSGYGPVTCFCDNGDELSRPQQKGISLSLSIFQLLRGTSV